MNFDLGEDDRLLVEGVREFCEREIAPHAAAWDEAEAMPEDLPARLAELGLLGMELPEETGGVGLSAVAGAAVVAELARASAAVALSVAAHNALVVGYVHRCATAEQRDRCLPPLVDGRWLGAFALSEPAAGTDATALETVARKAGNDYVLSGRKTTITHGTRAGLYLVAARIETGDGPIGTFAVEADRPGIEKTRVPTLGMCACDVGDVTFADVRVPASGLLGTPGESWRDLKAVLDRGRINVAAMATGIAHAAFEAARDYAKERRQFGRPIADFQAIQWKLADMATRLEAARLLVMQAAAAHDAGLRVRELAARAKVFAAETAVDAANDAVQIHGGYGYTREYPVERYLRDARLCGIGEGTNDVMRLLVGRAVARRFGGGAQA
ncbi:MAG: acyl-CoA dehydrogenase [Deltaproteobacteria bacterium]|nr:MAG: acyl-CoA dehydrogenase [Deltaproteobacteria bacterium]